MTNITALRGYAGLSWFMDGDALAIVRNDFVDLQASPALFLECPSCGSSNIIPPAEKYHSFTCDGCGTEFVPDLSGIVPLAADTAATQVAERTE